jgi:hypothetical protein
VLLAIGTTARLTGPGRASFDGAAQGERNGFSFSSALEKIDPVILRPRGIKFNGFLFMHVVAPVHGLSP